MFSPLFFTIVVLLMGALGSAFVSVDHVRRYLADVRVVRFASDVDRFRAIVKTQMRLAVAQSTLLGVANLLFVYGMLTDRFDIGHLLTVLVFDAVVVTTAKPVGALRDRARSLEVVDDVLADDYHHVSTVWVERNLPDW